MFSGTVGSGAQGVKIKPEGGVVASPLLAARCGSALHGGTSPRQTVQAPTVICPRQVPLALHRVDGGPMIVVGEPFW